MITLANCGSVTLVLLPLKYEIDDSVTVTVVLLGEAGRCTLVGWTQAYRKDRNRLARSKFTEFLLTHYTSAFLVVLFDEYSRNVFHYTLSFIIIRYARLHATSASL